MHNFKKENVSNKVWWKAKVQVWISTKMWSLHGKREDDKMESPFLPLCWKKESEASKKGQCGTLVI